MATAVGGYCGSHSGGWTRKSGGGVGRAGAPGPWVPGPEQSELLGERVTCQATRPLHHPHRPPPCPACTLPYRLTSRLMCGFWLDAVPGGWPGPCSQLRSGTGFRPARASLDVSYRGSFSCRSHAKRQLPRLLAAEAYGSGRQLPRLLAAEALGDV